MEAVICAISGCHSQECALWSLGSRLSNCTFGSVKFGYDGEAELGFESHDLLSQLSGYNPGG